MRNMSSKIQRVVLGAVLVLIAAIVSAVWLVLAEPEDPTANWQTYRNEEYGYEVKYPKGWELDIDLAPYQVGFKHLDYSCSWPPENCFGGLITAHKQQISIHESWQEAAFSTMTQEMEDRIVKIRFKDDQAFRLTECPGRIIFGDKDYEFCGEKILFPHPKKDIVLDFGISLFPYEDETHREEILHIFNQMLSTFQFVD